MKKVYIFPLVVAIVILYGLCFPVISVYGGVNIWLGGFYTVKHKDLAYFRINYGNDFVFRSIRAISLFFFLCILISLILVIKVSIQMKKRWISVNEAMAQWDRISLSFLFFLVIYIIFVTVVAKVVYYKIGIFIQFLGGLTGLVPSLSRLKKYNYKINKYLTLKLQSYETVIYIAREPFQICKHLLINIPVGHVNDIESLDELVDDYGEERENEFFAHEVEITPKELFKGHCSNLQVWVENNYDTCLLNSNLAFPLLKRLTEVGDLKALSVFKEEVRKRFESLYPPVQQYLISEGYLEYFSISEKNELLKYVLSIDTWIAIAENYLVKCQKEDAIKAYEYALNIDPINKFILEKLYNLSKVTNNYQKALKYYKLLSEFYELKNLDYLTLGDIYSKLCQYSNAKRMYRRILWRSELNCEYQALVKLGDLYFSEKRIERAKRMYRDAIKLNPNEVRARIRLSDLFQTEGKIHQAIETLNEGLRDSPFNASLLLRLLLRYKENKNYWHYIKSSIHITLLSHYNAFEE